MNEFKYTRGTWKVSYAGVEKETHIYEKENGDILARIDPIKDSIGTEEEILANMNLIAAAPEMLEALYYVFRPEQACIPLTVDTCKKVQAAIDKAVGKTE